MQMMRMPPLTFPSFHCIMPTGEIGEVDVSVTVAVNTIEVFWFIVEIFGATIVLVLCKFITKLNVPVLVECDPSPP